MNTTIIRDRGRLCPSTNPQHAPKAKSRFTKIATACASVLFLGAISGEAATYYVTQSGAGSANGTSLANAWSVTAFNSSTIPTGGDTVVFSGNITSTVRPAKNGTGNGASRLTLDFSGATLSTANPRIALSGKSYLNINGGTMGSTTSENCISFGGTQSRDITIQNWKQTAATNNVGAFVTLNYCYNVVIANNNLTNTRCIVQGDSILNHDITIANNYAITSNNTTDQTDLIFLGDAYNVTIEGNKLVQRTEGATTGRHNDIIQTYKKGGSNAGNPGGWVVRYNWLELDVRTGSGDTSFMMMENMNNRGGADAIKIYGNVFHGTSTDSKSNNGICFGYNEAAAVVRFYNNTIVRKNGPDNTIRFRAPGVLYAQNNVGYATQSGMGTYLVWTMTNAKVANNWFYNFGASSSLTGTNGGTSDPQLTDLAGNDFSLKSTSPVRGRGDSTIGTEYNRGIAVGATWPNPTLATRSPWDLGAYAPGSSTTSPTGDTTPPTISAVTASAAGTTATVNWTTNEASSSKVEYGTSAAFGQVVTNATMVTAHQASIPNLAASTTYYYRVQSTDAAGNVASSPTSTFTTASATAQLSVQPGKLDFGQVATGSSKEMSVILTNTGGASISGSGNVSAPFSIVSGGSYTLAGGQNQEIKVRYTPTGSTANSGALILSGGSGITVPVSGSGAQAASSLNVEAESGTITAPFVTSNGMISQSVTTTSVASAGRAAYLLNVPEAGQYAVVMSLVAPTEASNSIFYNIDAEPQDPNMVWDIPVTSTSVTNRTGGWRGTGTPEANQYTPKYFDLTAGTHQLIIRGREAGVKIDKVSLVKKTAEPVAFEAESGTITSPFVVSNGMISQSVQTTAVASAGRAAYNVNVPEAGRYAVVMSLVAATEASNSIFYNFDAEPQDPTMVWDIPVTSTAVTDRTAGWRGTGTPEANQYAAKYFDLTAGNHQLIIRGREAGVRIDKVKLVKQP